MYVAPDFLQRHVLLHDLQDVGLQAEVVDERLGNSAHSVLELHHRDAAAALFRRRGAEFRDQRMLLQEPGERALQLARPVSVDEPDRPLIGQQRLIEKPFGPRDRFVNGAADDVQVGRGAVARLQLDADASRSTPLPAPPSTRRSRTAGAHAFAAHVEVGRAVVHGCHDGLQPEAADDHAVADHRRVLRRLGPRGLARRLGESRATIVSSACRASARSVAGVARGQPAAAPVAMLRSWPSGPR